MVYNDLTLDDSGWSNGSDIRTFVLIDVFTSIVIYIITDPCMIFASFLALDFVAA
jgi:hypothetical protein